MFVCYLNGLCITDIANYFSVVRIQKGIILLLLLLSSSSSMYSRLLVIRWQSSGKSRSQQQIKAIYPNSLRMLCAVLTGVTILLLLLLFLL